MVKRTRKDIAQDEALATLRTLRDDAAAAGTPEAQTTLRRALASDAYRIVAAGAGVIGTHELDGFVRDLSAAFAHFIEDGAKRDPGCKAKLAIIETLLRLRAPAEDTFVVGVRLVQREPVLGGSEDTAPALRGHCALGLAQEMHAAAGVELARLLADPEWVARAGAAHALACVNVLTAEALLRLKVHTGDAEPQVLGECFRSLLAVAPERSLAFVAEQLETAEEAVAEQAALALGESRLAAALAPLVTWFGVVRRDQRRVALLALSMLRSDAAYDFVLAQIATADVLTAAHAIDAVAVYKHDDKLRERALIAARGRKEATLRAKADEALRA